MRLETAEHQFCPADQGWDCNPLPADHFSSAAECVGRPGADLQPACLNGRSCKLLLASPGLVRIAILGAFRYLTRLAGVNFHCDGTNA